MFFMFWIRVSSPYFCFSFFFLCQKTSQPTQVLHKKENNSDRKTEENKKAKYLRRFET